MNTHFSAPSKTRNGKPSPKSAPALKVSERTINGLKEIFRMLADESRLKILLVLAEEGEKHVSALRDLLDQSQPAVSHHLTLLRMAGLVGYRRDGKHNYYRVESSLVSQLLEQFFVDAGNGHRRFQFAGFSLAYRRR